MNVFEGDVRQVAKHFDASLGPFDERGRADDADDAGTRFDAEHFVPRAKPLRDVPEREVSLYTHLRDLPAHHAECPHAEEAYRGEIQSLLHDLEENHPGTRHSIMAGYEELAGLAAEEYREDDGGETALGECERCGSKTSRDVCRKCRLVASIEAV